MLFQARFWPLIVDGSVTVTFRRWKRRQVVAGNRYRTGHRIVVRQMIEVDTRLDRLDRASTHGAWTRAVLAVIAAQPATRAADLAAGFGRETLPFKTDVRKLKNLGLTESLEVGYRLSPRGEAYVMDGP